MNESTLHCKFCDGHRRWAERYAERSGVTVEWLKEHGREVRPCEEDCDYEGCEGWQMVNVALYNEDLSALGKIREG